MEVQVRRQNVVRRQNTTLRFTRKMQKKLVVLFLFILAAFVGLSAQLFLINRDNGETYKKQVLSHQEYDSSVIPFKRGEIEIGRAHV